MEKKQESLGDKVELFRFVRQLKRRWPLLVLFVLIGLGIGTLVSRYKKQLFKASATVKIDDSSSKLSEFLAIEMFSETFDQYNEVLTEARIVSSRTMIMKALDKLSLDVRYYKQGKVASYELYKVSPIKLNPISQIDQDRPLSFQLKVNSDLQSFSLEVIEVDGELVEGPIFNLKFNQIFEFEGKSYSIVKSQFEEANDLELDGSYLIETQNRLALAEEFSANLLVNQVEDKVSILEISFISSNPLLCKDFVEALTNAYTSKQLEEKSQVAGNTLKFINTSLDQLSVKMNEVESKITEFKQDKRIIDFDATEEIESEKLIDLESKKRLAELKLLNLEIIENELNQGRILSDVSINAEGNLDPALSELISIFNSLKIEKATLGVKYTADSKRAKAIDQKIDKTINLIRENVALAYRGVKKEIAFLEEKIGVLNRRYDVFPQYQRDYFHLIRNFEVNQKVVAFLMEKKIEASIANASVVADTKIIDLPVVPTETISLSKSKIILISLLVSLLLSFSVITLLVFFNDKVYDKAILQESSNIPILGTLTKSSTTNFKSLGEILGDERTVFSESVKSLRTNLKFIPESKSAQVISITSTISKEGKSFTLINLAASLSLLKKSVVVVDLDLRKPKIQNYFNADNTLNGASMYLSEKVEIDEVINKSTHDYLYYIMSGPIPPNPMELIQSDRFETMIKELKEKFDYVLIDNPPIGVVADAINVMLKSDLNLYVVRADYSKVEFLETAENAKDKHRLENLYLVLNGVKASANNYYGNYAQGYYTDQRSSGILPWSKRD